MKPLSQTSQGETCTIQWMFGTPEALHAMHDMNLQEGSRIRVIQKFRDCLIIGANERRIALGTDVAARIQVGVC